MPSFSCFVELINVLSEAGETSSVLTSGDSQYEYEISLTCQGLPNDSSGLAPNTYAVVQCQNEAGGKWLPNGHTEIVEVRRPRQPVRVCWGLLNCLLLSSSTAVQFSRNKES